MVRSGAQRVIGVALVLLALSGCGANAEGAAPSVVPLPSSPPPSASADPPSASADAFFASVPLLPAERHELTSDSFAELTAVQLFADDVAEGDIDSLLQHCSVLDPDTVRERYGSDVARGAISEAFAHQGMGAQPGIVWQGEHLLVVARGGQMRTGYACPDLVIDGASPALEARDLGYIIDRLVARDDGTPLSPVDADGVPWLLCDDAPGGWRGDSLAVAPSASDPGRILAVARQLQGGDLHIATEGDPQDRYYFVAAPELSDAQLVIRDRGGFVCVGEAEEIGG